MPAAPIAVRALFLNVQLCGVAPAVANVSVLRNSIYDDPQSIKTYWQAASFGRVYFNESTSSIVDLQLPCNGSFDETTCDSNAWAAYLSANATAVLGPGQDLSQFQFRVRATAERLATPPVLSVRGCFARRFTQDKAALRIAQRDSSTGLTCCFHVVRRCSWRPPPQRAKTSALASRRASTPTSAPTLAPTVSPQRAPRAGGSATMHG